MDRFSINRRYFFIQPNKIHFSSDDHDFLIIFAINNVPFKLHKYFVEVTSSKFQKMNKNEHSVPEPNVH